MLFKFFFIIYFLLFGFFIFGYSKLSLLDQVFTNYLSVIIIFIWGWAEFFLIENIYIKNNFSFDFSKSQVSSCTPWLQRGAAPVSKYQTNPSSHKPIFWGLLGLHRPITQKLNLQEKLPTLSFLFVNCKYPFLSLYLYTKFCIFPLVQVLQAFCFVIHLDTYRYLCVREREREGDLYGEIRG